MQSRRTFVTALAAVAFGLATAATIGAIGSESHTMYLTFNRPVSLPGVALGTGTYIFEVPDSPGSHDIVRVLSRDRKTVYFMALTNPIYRPSGTRGERPVSFAEASPDVPQPIAVWWADGSLGRQFIYPKK